MAELTQFGALDCSSAQWLCFRDTCSEAWLPSRRVPSTAIIPKHIAEVKTILVRKRSNYVPPSDDGDSDSTEVSDEEGDDAGGGGSGNKLPRETSWQGNFPDFASLSFTVTNPRSQVSTYNLNCELDYFHLFFTDQLIEEIVREMNS